MEVSEEKYFEFKVKLVCAALPAVIEKYEKPIDNEQHRQTLSWQAVAIAESVLKEIGFDEA